MKEPGTRFHRACAGLSLAWLLLVPLLQPLPFERVLVGIDLPQFYLAGALVAAGRADALYAIPRTDSPHHPGLPADSEMHPEYAARAERIAMSRAPRFIGPPPLAVALVPLGSLPYGAAARLWPILLSLAQWGVALLAARFLVLALGRHSGWEGPLMLAIAFSPRSYVSILPGNISPLVAISIALAAWWILRGSPGPAGVALASGAVLKYASAAWVPLLIAARRWRVIAAAATAGAVLSALSLLVLGPEPFRVWLVEIAPRLGRAYVDPGNQSLWSTVAAGVGEARVGAGLRGAMLVSGLIALLGFCLLLFRRSPLEWRRPPLFLAAAAGLLAWLLIFSPVAWNAYQVYLMPFWGWLIWEAMRSRFRAVLVAATLAIANLPWFTLWREAFGQLPPAPLGLSGLGSSTVILGLAAYRIWAGDGTPRESRT